MFFITSINPKTHSVRIVGHATTVEEALTIMAAQADAYVKSKNAPIMHRKGEAADVKFTDRLVYFIPDSEHEHKIDVYYQQTHVTKGWFAGTSIRDESTLVRLFRFVEYKAALVDDEEAPENVELVKQRRVAQAKKMNLTPTTTHGGFPQSILAGLEQSERFQQSRVVADQNLLPKKGGNRFISVVSDDDNDESAET